MPSVAPPPAEPPDAGNFEGLRQAGAIESEEICEDSLPQWDGRRASEVIDALWVTTTRRGADGEFLSYKARCVANNPKAKHRPARADDFVFAVLVTRILCSLSTFAYLRRSTTSGCMRKTTTSPWRSRTTPSRKRSLRARRT